MAVPASRDHDNCTKHKRQRQGLEPEEISSSGEGKGVQDALRLWKKRKRTAELYSSCASCFYSVIWRDSETAIKWDQALETMYLTMMQK